ncbi:hypothetical protein J6590_081779 [Homalodisca vitripennis]|nr:hypothetical protein J6590_081779 [Homalodisca vitripennis]
MLMFTSLAKIFVPNALFQPLRRQKHKQIAAGPRPVILLPAVLTVCVLFHLLKLIFVVSLVDYVFRKGEKYGDLLKRKLSEKFPDSIIPHRNAVITLIVTFRATGSVGDSERIGRPRKPNEQKLLDISDSMAQSPTNQSVSNSTMSDLLPHIKLSDENVFPYKIRCVQELKSSDNEKRLNYCYRCQLFIERHSEHILNVIFYTHEAWFNL